jgi:hypothetical protein
MASHWPELMPEDRYRPARALALSFTVATIGGAVGWTLFFLGTGLWGLVVGVAVVVFLAANAARTGGARRRFESIAISLACSLLSWPLVWIVAVVVRYWVTGKTVGS